MTSRGLYAPGAGYDSDRCACCGGVLSQTQVTSQPQAIDHLPDCKYYAIAVKVARYAKEVERVTSEATGRGSSGRHPRRYMQKSAKDLSAAACAPNPRVAIKKLAKRYEKDIRKAEVAETLMRACQALARSEDPTSITSVP